MPLRREGGSRHQICCPGNGSDASLLAAPPAQDAARLVVDSDIKFMSNCSDAPLVAAQDAPRLVDSDATFAVQPLVTMQ